MNLKSIAENQARLNYELAVYREQIALLKRETDRITLTTIDLSNALNTVEGLEGGEVLVPIGGGTMIKGEVKDTKVLVPIGAGYVVEMEKEKASAEVQKRIVATKNAIEKLNTEYAKVLMKLQEVAIQLKDVQAKAMIDRQVEENIGEDYR